MSEAILSPKRRANSDDNLIPLINIVFLLLIFFMVAGQIDAFQPADVVLPEMEVDKKAAVGSLNIVLASSSAMNVDGQRMDLKQLGTLIGTLDVSLPETKITLQADKQVTAAVLSPVLSVLRKHQVSSITLYVQRPAPES